MKNKMRIIVLMHESLIPPEKVDGPIDRDKEKWITEYDVVTTLRKMGHEVLPVGVISDLAKIKQAVEEFKPHLVYNLLEEFDGEALFDQNVVSYLELLRVPYTGCNPRGLMMARDKALSKKIMAYHRIPTPKFCVFPKNKKTKRPKHLDFPLIVKCLNEEASLGISQASVVNSDEKLQERVEYINKTLEVDAIAEEFVEGREFYVGILGNYRLKTLPVWELSFENADNPEKEIYSERAKFNKDYRKRKGIKTAHAKLDKDIEKKVFDLCRKTYKALSLNGYARIDLRIDSQNKIYIMEANPNPDISHDDEFALSAKYVKITYKQLLARILSLAKTWHSYQ